MNRKHLFNKIVDSENIVVKLRFESGAKFGTGLLAQNVVMPANEVSSILLSVEILPGC